VSAGDIVRIGACVACGKRARVQSGGCGPCVRRIGEHWFALSERVKRDPVFARAAFARIAHRAGQAKFIEMYGIEVLGLAPVVSGAVNLERELVSEGRWVRRQEWTIPPPKRDER
jgi:hypothetical protein